MRTRTWFQIALASLIGGLLAPSEFMVFFLLAGVISLGNVIAHVMDKIEKKNWALANFIRGLIIALVSIWAFITQDNLMFYIFTAFNLINFAHILWGNERTLTITVNLTPEQMKDLCRPMSSEPMSSEVQDALKEEAEEMYRKAHKILV